MATPKLSPTPSKFDAAKGTQRLGFRYGWKIRIIGLVIGLTWAVLDLEWKTIDKYFPKLNDYIHFGTATSHGDIDFLMGRLNQDMKQWSEACNENMTFEQCRAATLANKPVLEDLKLRVNKMEAAWNNELKENNVPQGCQAEMNEVVTTYKNYVKIENDIVAMLESMNTPESSKTLMVQYNGLSSKENEVWQDFRKLKKGACKGY